LIVAIYIRVSSEEQAEKGYSLAEQDRVCQEKAVAMGASNIVVYADEGISGGILERPALLRLREALRRREINVLLCRDPDRLSRNLTHQLIIADECEKYDVRLEFTGWEWKNTPEGQLFFAIRGAISQYEKEKIRERMKRGKTQKALSGLEPNKINIYGYTYSSEGQALVNEKEAETIRGIFQWFTSADDGITKIANRLNDMGKPGPGGKRWYKQTVRYILSNQTYIGQHIYNKRDQEGVINNKYTKEKIKVTLRPDSEWVIIPFPSLVPENIFWSAQEKLSRCRRLWAGKPRNFYLLSGLLTCGDCGNTMYGMLDHYKRPRRKVVYTCRRESSIKEYCLPRKYVKGLSIESFVWKTVVSWIYEPEKIFENIREIQDNSAPVEQRIAELMSQLQAVEKGRKNVLEVLASGTTSLDETTKGILKQLTEKEQNIRKQLDELKIDHLKQASRQEIANIAASGKVLKKYLDRLTVQEKKAIIRAFISEIKVYGHGDNFSLVISAAIPTVDVLTRLIEKHHVAEN